MSDASAASHEVMDLPAHPSAAWSARRFISRTLRGWSQPTAVVDSAVLLVSELTGNAIRHGRGLIMVTARLRATTVRVEVHDDSPALPETLPPGLDDEGGRGIWLVEAIAERWGVTTHPDDGKEVWFELTGRPDPADPAGPTPDAQLTQDVAELDIGGVDPAMEMRLDRPSDLRV